MKHKEENDWIKWTQHRWAVEWDKVVQLVTGWGYRKMSEE